MPDLTGTRFALTGRLALERHEIERILKALGARVVDGVSGREDYLVVGEEPNLYALNKAMEWGSRMLDEEEFWQLLGRPQPRPSTPVVIESFQPLFLPPPPGIPDIDDAIYSVVDVETSGRRLCEIAIVQVTSTGELVNEYATLVNPGNQMSYTRIHGITNAHVKDAPRFRDIAGDIVSRLRGNVFVAHNVGFDRNVIDSEFKLLGHKLPLFSELCTMRIARKLKLHPPRSAKLGDCCRHMGITIERAHAALSDTRATAELLVKYLEAAKASGVTSLDDLGLRHAPAPFEQWPNLAPSHRVHLRTGTSLRV